MLSVFQLYLPSLCLCFCSSFICRVATLDISNRDFNLIWLELRFPSCNHFFWFTFKYWAFVCYRLHKPYYCPRIFRDSQLRVPGILFWHFGHGLRRRNNWLWSTIYLGYLTSPPKHTHTHHGTGYRANALDHILASIPSLYSNISTLPPVGSSDHCVIT